MLRLPTILLLAASAFPPEAGAQADADRDVLRVVFYNVENLFDTIDEPDKLDDDFLPSSEKAWGTRRYSAKLDSLARAVRAAARDLPPDLVGLAEVENRLVLEDLAQAIGRGEAEYGVVHYESPDLRGIDVALLHRTDRRGLKLRKASRLRLAFPDEPLQVIRETGDSVPYTSRDILHAEFKLGGLRGPLHVFVNHWPSRRGGLEASEPRRVVAASRLRARIDSLHAAGGDPRILAMGDFNDEPPDRSLAEILGASTGGSGEGLVNLMGPPDAAGEGTYNFRGDWNMLDHFVVSANLAEGGNARWEVGSCGIHRTDRLLHFSDRFGPTPNRTYGGPNYYGGTSDHLPIQLQLIRAR